MRGRLILNLMLLVVIAAGGALLYFEPWAEPPEKAPRVVDVAPDAVDRLTIERTGDDGDTTVLERGDAGWRIAEPFAMRADATQVDGLIKNLRQRSKDHFPVADRDLAGFGLAEPKVRVRVGETTVAIGGEAPIERARYVKVGTTIYVAGTDLARSADKPATGFVPRRLVPENAKISAVESKTFKVVRATQTEDATWTVARSQTEPAKGAAKTLANAWSGATAVEVKRRVEGDAPAASVRVHLADRDASLEFIRLGKAGDTATGQANIAVTRPDLPVRYIVTGPTAERLFRLPTKAASGKGGDQKS